MNKEIKQYISEFESIYNGEPFYGKSLMAILESANPATVFNKPNDAGHSAWEITHHLYAWRDLLGKRLNGDTHSSIESDSKEDWAPVPEDKTAGTWRALIKKLETNQQDILSALSRFKDADLDGKFAGSAYTLRTFLNGQIQHDIYHIGQIALAFKNAMAGKKTTAPLM